jgi:anti-sigma B factor antagonist
LTTPRDQSWDIPLRINAVGRDGSLVLVLEGDLDITSSPLLDEALERARATDAVKIVVDLVAVNFIDSTGLHVLIKHAGAQESRARIRVTKGSPQVQRLFELTEASRYLQFVSD